MFLSLDILSSSFSFLFRTFFIVFVFCQKTELFSFYFFILISSSPIYQKSVRFFHCEIKLKKDRQNFITTISKKRFCLSFFLYFIFSTLNTTVSPLIFHSFVNSFSWIASCIKIKSFARTFSLMASSCFFIIVPILSFPYKYTCI